MAKLIGAVAAVLLLQLAAATPSRWQSAHIAVPNPAYLNCLSHPDLASLATFGSNSHGAPSTAPVVNTGIVYTLTDSAGAAVQAMCPGVAYTLQVALPISANIWLTTSGGSFTNYGSLNRVDCLNGSRLYSSNQATSFTQTLTATCAQLATQATVTIKATIAGGQGDSFKFNTLTVPVDPNCYNTTCSGPQPPPPPSPSPGPPMPSPSPAPAGPPVYPSCIGAPLLRNPCPLGKRCFYNTECQPQMEDLVYPNCDNAAPLSNPWPAGKCCFYDSQCKNQCEDLTNSKCVARKIPTCKVKGCGWCSATNSSSCERCWIGYQLNLQTKACDCAPGYYFVSSSTGGSCALCGSGKISYGGKMATTTTCVTCPAGRVANKEQSECVLANSWDHWGYDLTNRRWGYAETTLNLTNVASLKNKWSWNASGDVTATPTVYNGRLYFPDWNGKMWCLDAATGAQIWVKQILTDWLLDATKVDQTMLYPANPKNTSIISRASPAIVPGTPNKLVVPVMMKGGGYPFLLMVNADGTPQQQGQLVWGKRVEAHPAAMLTMSPTVHAGYIYQGISSLEELWATNANYSCCTFRGNMIKVDAATGAILWRTYMAPDNNNQVGGFSGNSLWGSSPAIDVRRNQVYIATGNNYEAPEVYTQCIYTATGGNITPENYAAVLQCEQLYGQGNYHNSMLALDMGTGAIKWVRQLGGPDAWNGACMMGGGNPNCRPGLMDLNSPDYDFGQAPMLVKACKGGFCKQLVVAGQKSGWLWALNPENGEVHWSLPVGPGGTVGGLQWGSAADNSRIYVANNNYLSVTADLTSMKSVVNWMATTNQLPPTTTDGGLAAAIDAYTGQVLWTFANPTLHWDNSGKHARSQAPMTVANDILFYPSMDPDGTLFMLDARTGKLLNSFKTGQTTGCGPAVVNGKVYVGSGYANFGLGLPGNKLHMLSL